MLSSTFQEPALSQMCRRVQSIVYLFCLQVVCRPQAKRHVYITELTPKNNSDGQDANVVGPFFQVNRLLS